MAEAVVTRQKPQKGAWAITFLLFFFMMVNFADKAIIGLAGVPIMTELGLTPSEFGLVGSSFFLLFSLSAIVTGFIVNHVQSRWALFAMGLVWALVQFPMLGTVSIELLIASRIVLGAAEGPAYPVALHAAYKWFPDDQRAMPGAVIAQGSALGVIIAVPILSWIITHYSWHWAFGALGIAGLAWAIVWLFVGKEGTVEDRPRETRDELGERLPYARLLLNSTNLASWAIYFGAYFGLALGLSWFTPFLVKGLGFTQEVAGKVTAVPFVVGAIVVLLGSLASQRMVQMGVSSRRGRGVFCGLLTITGGACLIASTFVHDPMLRIAMMVAGTALPSVVYTIVPIIIAEITPTAQRGAVLAIGSAVGTSAGIFAPFVMGSVVQDAATVAQGFDYGYMVCGIVSMIGGLIGLVYLQPERQKVAIARPRLIVATGD